MAFIPFDEKDISLSYLIILIFINEIMNIHDGHILASM